MSRKFLPQFADPRGVLLTNLLGFGNGLIAEGSTVPADTTAGYAAGCLFFKRGGTVGAQLYINQGSNTSCLFQALTSTGGIDLSGLLATAVELNRAADVSTRVIAVPAATTTLTLTEATHEGKTLVISSTGGLAVTPPAATGSGGKYRFICGAVISGGNFTVDAKAGNSSDVFTGWMQSYKATTFTPYPTAANSNLITFDGSTKGGAAIGDWFEIEDFATHEWKVTGYTIQSGTIASMFSNH